MFFFLGLFASAIAESGVALDPWAFTNQGRKRAFNLGESLGFKGDNAEDLIKFLRTIPAETLTEAAAKHTFSKEVGTNFDCILCLILLLCITFFMCSIG